MQLNAEKPGERVSYPPHSLYETTERLALSVNQLLPSLPESLPRAPVADCVIASGYLITVFSLCNMGCGSSKAVDVVAVQGQSPGEAPIRKQVAESPPSDGQASTSTTSNVASNGKDRSVEGPTDRAKDRSSDSVRASKHGDRNGDLTQHDKLPASGDSALSPERQRSQSGQEEGKKRFEAFDISLGEPTDEAAGGQGTPVRKPPRRLQKLESVPSALTSEELMHRNMQREKKQRERREAELEKKREGGRRHSRRDRFRQEVLQARQTCEEANDQKSNTLLVPEVSELRGAKQPLPEIRSNREAETNGHIQVGPEDKLANGLGSESTSDLQVAELEKDDDLLASDSQKGGWNKNRTNGEGDQSTSDEW